MFYPDNLKPFVEFSKFLAEALSYIDTLSPKFTTALREDNDVLIPYLERSFPIIVDIYVTSMEEVLGDGKPVLEDDKPKSLDELRDIFDNFKSEDYVRSLLPDTPGPDYTLLSF